LTHHTNVLKTEPDAKPMRPLVYALIALNCLN